MGRQDDYAGGEQVRRGTHCPHHGAKNFTNPPSFLTLCKLSLSASLATFPSPPLPSLTGAFAPPAMSGRRFEYATDCLSMYA